MDAWESRLDARLDALGAEPTEDQQQALASWVQNNVPAAFWGSVAWRLPGDLCTDFRMMSAECGF
jgi:hypothetical protein